MGGDHMGLLKRIRYRIVCRQGWAPEAYAEYRAMIRADRRNPHTGRRAKRWAHRRGFTSDRIERYGLTEANYRDYISDREFAWGFPYNSPFSRWIDDKLTLYYTLFPFRDYLPDYYFMADRTGRWFSLFDAPDGAAAGPEACVALLREQRHLALKLFSGSEGAGFCHLACGREGQFFRNGDPIGEPALLGFLGQLRGYLVTEYLKPCSELAAVYPGTANSLRIVAVNLPGIDDPIARALIRFGCKASGEADNTSQGSVFCLVDVHSGRYSQGQQDVGGRRVHPETHPDTGAPLSGQVPRWAEIRKLVTDICRYMPQLVLLGFDVVVSDRGIRMIEINSLPEHQDYQLSGPLKKDPHYSRLWAYTLEQKGRSAP